MAIKLGTSILLVLLIRHSIATPEVVCPEVNGFFADALDCCIFYRCVGGRPYQFFCPKGTFFDPIAKLCNWPQQVQDCDSKGRRIYYEKIDQPQYGENMYENKPETEPEAEPEAEPDVKPEPPSVPESEPEYPFYADSDYNSVGIQENAFVCPESEGFFAHPYDCNRFYRCVHHRPYSFTCAHGTFFDQSISVCNFPERVSECDHNGNRYFSVVGHNGAQLGSIEKNSKDLNMFNPEMHATGFIPCSEQYSLHPHPKSCSKFIYCHDYKGLLFECPQGLNFDRKRLTCDFPQNAKC